MSAVSKPIDQQNVTVPTDVQPATTVETKNYLDRCVEQLDPSVASTREWCAFGYRTAAKAATVGYIVLAVSIFVATGIFAPVYVPIAAICTITFSNVVLVFIKNLYHTAEQFDERADKLKKIKLIYDNLASATPQQVATKLDELDITINYKSVDPTSLNSLKALIARYDFWQERSVTCEKQHAAALDEANRQSDENYFEHRFSINSLREDAVNLRRQSVDAKVRSAFILAVVQRPDIKGVLESIGDFPPIVPLEQLLGNYAEDDKVDELFTFKNKKIQPITIDDAQRKSSFELSKRLLEGVPA